MVYDYASMELFCNCSKAVKAGVVKAGDKVKMTRTSDVVHSHGGSHVQFTCSKCGAVKYKRIHV